MRHCSSVCDVFYADDMLYLGKVFYTSRVSFFGQNTHPISAFIYHLGFY
ncbi:Uncharacterised protein [Yersinia similis]|uniref:Uncharacterized protein n=1 Tax=Yersinia similis TaxID=367190 RepID=A0A0T9P169_9GAMM|nr:Uncharacterised protein [Yersinia similis]CNB24064.1 Uncharacterised protein [Yersinia similis]CNE13690.1 Uncharacterised protein [Yersinia similis]CNF27929.1 Uncharacterised protein [Yersinia similis]CNH40576.1 Uncharacterised protein [Yersinia similis]